jgi:hypothetical protein
MSDTQDVEALVARLEARARTAPTRFHWSVTELTEAATALRTLARERDEQHGIVARIWELLGSPSYEDLAGRSIYDLIEELKADRARASSLEAQLAGAMEDAAHTLSRSRSAGVDQVIEQLEAAAEALASAPASNKEPAPMTKQPVTVRAYVDDYEFRGDEACHTPTENERAMIEDAIEGYLFEIGASAPGIAEVGDPCMWDRDKLCTCGGAACEQVSFGDDDAALTPPEGRDGKEVRLTADDARLLDKALTASTEHLYDTTPEASHDR